MSPYREGSRCPIHIESAERGTSTLQQILLIHRMVLQAILDRAALCPALARSAASSSRGPLLGPRVRMASLRLLIPHLPAHAPAIFAWCAAHPRGADAAPAVTMPVLGPHRGPSPLLPAQPSQLAGGSDLCLLHYARTAPREPHRDHASSSRDGSPPSPGPSRIEPAGRSTFTGTFATKSANRKSGNISNHRSSANQGMARLPSRQPAPAS